MKHSLPKAQVVGKILKKAALSTDDAMKKLNPLQKNRLAKGKNVAVDLSFKESKAKSDLIKNIENRTNPKKLTREQLYQKAIEDMYKKKGGSTSMKKYQATGQVKQPKQIGTVPNIKDIKPKFPKNFDWDNEMKKPNSFDWDQKAVKMDTKKVVKKGGSIKRKK